MLTPAGPSVRALPMSSLMLAAGPGVMCRLPGRIWISLLAVEPAAKPGSAPVL